MILPALFVGADGKSHFTRVLAPRLKLADLKGHALMLHAGGDNRDHPAKLAVACAYGFAVELKANRAPPDLFSASNSCRSGGGGLISCRRH